MQRYHNLSWINWTAVLSRGNLRLTDPVAAERYAEFRSGVWRALSVGGVSGEEYYEYAPMLNHLEPDDPLLLAVLGRRYEARGSNALLSDFVKKWTQLGLGQLGVPK